MHIYFRIDEKKILPAKENPMVRVWVVEKGNDVAHAINSDCICHVPLNLPPCFFLFAVVLYLFVDVVFAGVLYVY